MSHAPTRPVTPVDPPVTGEKHCPRCGRTLHVLAFAVDRTREDGLHAYCRECMGAIEKNRYRRTHKIPFYGVRGR